MDILDHPFYCSALGIFVLALSEQESSALLFVEVLYNPGKRAFCYRYVVYIHAPGLHRLFKKSETRKTG